MNPLNATAYTSPARTAPSFISLRFYLKLLWIVVSEGHKAAKKYTGDDWVHASMRVFAALEESGVNFTIEGMDRYTALDTPAVFIGNHMSTLETFILPALIQPHMDVTFVVKESLLRYPFFKHVLSSRDPIVVGRSNPREDLKNVLDGGVQRLKEGRSIIIFPQSTRSASLDAKQFNSIGVKLAKKAGVPIVPVALKSDAWSAGSLIKDFGPIIPSRPVHFYFGSPISVTSGNGKEEHEEVYSFIESHLASWADTPGLR